MQKIYTGFEIKKLLSESVGVPDNIVETTNEIINQIILKLGENKNNVIKSSINLLISGNFIISDFEFDKINIIINLIREYNYDGIDLGSAYQTGKTINYDDFKVKNIEYSTDNNAIIFNFITDSTFTITNVNMVKIFEYEKINLSRILAHELKHLFDIIKKPINSIEKKSEYVSLTGNIGKSIKPLNQFIMGLYYNHDFESQIRNSELYSLVYNYNIKKDEFYNFLINSDIYKQLTTYKNLTIDNIINDLKTNYMADVTDKLTQFNIKNLNNMNSEQKIFELFNILYVALTKTKFMSLKGFLKDPVSNILEFGTKNYDFFQKEVIKASTMNIMHYFHNKQIEMNINADKSLKKLAKLYSLIQEGRISIDKTGLIL